MKYIKNKITPVIKEIKVFFIILFAAYFISFWIEVLKGNV
jgi:hypothetical protein